MRIHVFEFSFIGPKISFVIRNSGNYKIEAWGASGGGPSGVRGAYSKSFVSLSSKDNLSILVGESGWNGYNSGTSIECGGGGGGSFVAKGTTPICVGGGGGGFSNSISNSQSEYKYSYGQSTELGGDPESRGGVSVRSGGLSGEYYGGGGGGFSGNGQDASSSGKGGISFQNGGNRQESSSYNAYGGFGGGGSNHGNCGFAAGGGGYTGGSASKSGTRPGGGGGSFHTGKYQNEESISISGFDSYPTNPSNNKHGYVIITQLSEQSSNLKNHSKNVCNHFDVFSFIFIYFLIITKF